MTLRWQEVIRGTTTWAGHPLQSTNFYIIEKKAFILNVKYCNSFSEHVCWILLADEPDARARRALWCCPALPLHLPPGNHTALTTTEQPHLINHTTINNQNNPHRPHPVNHKTSRKPHQPHHIKQSHPRHQINHTTSSTPHQLPHHMNHTTLTKSYPLHHINHPNSPPPHPPDHSRHTISSTPHQTHHIKLTTSSKPH